MTESVITWFQAISEPEAKEKKLNNTDLRVGENGEFYFIGKLHFN